MRSSWVQDLLRRETRTLTVRGGKPRPQWEARACCQAGFQEKEEESLNSGLCTWVCVCFVYKYYQLGLTAACPMRKFDCSSCPECTVSGRVLNLPPQMFIELDCCLRLMLLINPHILCLWRAALSVHSYLPGLSLCISKSPYAHFLSPILSPLFNPFPLDLCVEREVNGYLCVALLSTAAWRHEAET